MKQKKFLDKKVIVVDNTNDIFTGELKFIGLNFFNQKTAVIDRTPLTVRSFDDVYLFDEYLLVDLKIKYKKL